MGVYTRFKKDPDGFRKLVELLESTRGARRQKMIDVGMAEDAAYTERALKYVFDFKDFIGMPDPELAEVIGATAPELVGYAIHSEDEQIKQQFLRLAPPKMVPGIREVFDLPVTPLQQVGARAKMIESARRLEKRGVVKTKQIPR